MATSFTGDFARLVPRNHVAQVLFSKTCFYVERNDTFHLRFMDRTSSELLPGTDEPVETSTEYDTHPDTDTAGSRANSIQYLGDFVLSYDRERSPEIPHLGWRVGRGSSKFSKNRNVDLLLAKPGDNLGRSLTSIHIIFQFNRRSGFLMPRGGSPKVAVEFKMGGLWEKLDFEKEQLMHQPATMLRAGVCEYELEYTIEEKHREAYFRQRDAFLERTSLSKDNPQPFQKMPGDSSVLRGRYLEFGTKGSGAFGWITQGVDTKTGNPIAIKELRIDSRRSRREVELEVKMGRRFRDERGLLPVLDTWCEHGQPDGCCDLEKFHIFMPRAQSDFSINFWASPEISRRTKLRWLREPLEGIRALHAMGVMHRDIRLKNMLIMSTEPPRASLCDYAPEVWTVSKDGPYTAKIDMWAYGYAIAEILGYSVKKYPCPDTNNPQIKPNQLSTILKMLHAHCDKTPEDERLVDLVSKLLVWKPEDRWSAGQALEHECWCPITQEGEKDVEDEKDAVETELSRTKRTRSKIDM